jgi:Trypsin
MRITVAPLAALLLLTLCEKSQQETRKNPPPAQTLVPDRPAVDKLVPTLPLAEIARRALEAAYKAGKPGSVEFTVAYRRVAATLTGQHEFAGLPPRKIELDPTFTRNVGETLGARPEILIFHGTPVIDNSFDSTVAVLGRMGEVHCSGFVIAPRKIVTAGHCVDDATRIAEGNVLLGTLSVRNVIGRAVFGQADVGLLFLDSNVSTATFERMAGTDTIDGTSSLRVVGYGEDEVGTMGVKAFADVNIASYRCDGQGDATKWGCTAPFELVADDKTYHADTCQGDSGAPAFVGFGAARRVAAIVKSSVAFGTNCVDGSIYTRGDASGLDDFLQNGTPR